MNLFRKEGLNLKPISKLGIINLLTSMGLAAAVTIWTVYLESFLHNPSYVGFLTSFFTIVSLLFFFFLIPFIEKHSKTKLYLLAVAVYVISYFIFSFFSSIYLIFIFGTIIAIAASLRISCFGVIVREKVGERKVSESEGLIYTTMNIAWLIGPLVAGFMANKYSNDVVFLFSAIIMTLSIIAFSLFRIKSKKVIKKPDRKIFKIAQEFFSNKNRIFVYLLEAGITFWWALIYVYMPIYVIENNLGDIALGIFLAAIVVPLIGLEYYFGKLTARTGFKKMFSLGYFILAVSAILCFIMNNHYVVLSILVLASVGAAMIEPSAEAYFFDIVSKRQREKFYGPYNTGIEVGSFFATGVSAVILLFLPFKFIFIFFGIITALLALLSLRIKNVVENMRR